MSKNALQAVLDRAAQNPEPAAPQPVASAVERKPRAPRQSARQASAGMTVKSEPTPFFRPSRENRQLIAGHFPKPVAKQLKMLAVEDDTTIQQLLEEALNLLFVKKGKQRIAEIVRGQE